jgi:hypothetical protein
MKKILFVLLMVILLLACSFSQSITQVVPNAETMVAGTFQALTAAAPPPNTMPATEPLPSPQPVGNLISFDNINFILPPEVAASALAGTIPAVIGDDPGWGLAPEYIKFELDGYALYNTFHTPQILVYPAQEYAAVNEGAGRSIAALQAILNGSAAPIAQNLPSIASFNAGQLFAAQIQVIQFKNGSGVRFLTEYGQYFATANNVDLFYQFQGLTSDGKYYIIAILPVSHPLLASDENPETIPPAGGVPFPGYDNESVLNTYYTDVVNLLNTAAPESYLPALTHFDALIQSIEVH